MATDIAALGFEVQSDQIAEANLQLRAMPQAASAAERAVKKWGASTSAAAAANDNFSKRVRRTLTDLDFQRQQLGRTTAEQEKYAAVKRAGVTAESAAGKAILSAVAAIQVQRAATEQAAKATGVSAKITAAAGEAWGKIAKTVAPVAIAMIAVTKAQEAWQSAMKAGDIGEQAEQIGVTTDQLQAYRFAGAQAGIATDQMDVALTKLAKSMGSANDGNKDMIELFQKLGVKLLDASGQLRPTADVLPEVAKGMLAIGSSSERTAALMTIFGKSGSKMATVLETVAQGNDTVVRSAQRAGAVLDKDVITAWDDFSDALVRASAAADVAYAKIGAPIATFSLKAVAQILSTINFAIAGISAGWSGLVGVFGSGSPGEELAKVDSDIAAFRDRGFADSDAALKELIDKRDALRNNVILGGSIPSMPVVTVTGSPPGSTGKSNPAAKGGGTDPYKTATESARDYIAAKNAETAAIGQSTEVAARMKHEQALLNKATSEGKTVTAEQTAAIKALAASMAQADAEFAKAKFMDDAVKESEKFIQTQQLERDTLFMSREAAAAYRYEQELLNKAANDNIVLTEAQKQRLGELAGAMAAQEEQTRRLREMYDLAKETVGGFVSDFVQGLREGASVWDAFGNAAMNALNKIADKLISMAVDDLFNSAFGGSKKSGGGGGFLSRILSGLGGLLGIGGGGSSGGQAVGAIYSGPMAKGGVFDQSNIVPFARGGIVNRPTLFPFARGVGLMGEAGPEAIIPLRRGRNGNLGVAASGAGGGDVYVTINNHTDSQVTARKSKGPGGQMNLDVLVEPIEQKIASRMARGQGSLGKTMQAQYGLQPVGR